MNDKKLNCVLKAALFATPALGLFLSPYKALAGSVVFDSQNTCTTINCLPTAINGSYETNANGNVDPFVLQIFSSGNECVRLDVISQGTDLETTLISPNGAIWKNDDRNGALDRRPLVKAITNVRGWYTLQISNFAGSSANADFTLLYGRYPSTNINCSPPTTPTTTSAPTSKPGGSAPVTSPPGGPNSR
jgi:hypothetical protein